MDSRKCPNELPKMPKLGQAWYVLFSILSLSRMYRSSLRLSAKKVILLIFISPNDDNIGGILKFNVNLVNQVTPVLWMSVENVSIIDIVRY